MPNRIGRPLPWKDIWLSVGTELSDPTEENRWFKWLHRGIWVRNRQDLEKMPEGATTLCRLGCGCEESQLHLAQCVKLRPFWQSIIDFLTDAGIPKPAHRAEAIIFNLWQGDVLGPVEARATMRHAFSSMYRRFSQVDLANQQFSSHAATLETLQAIRRALIRRAKRIQKLHANRIFTNLPDGVPDEDAGKFATLIHMNNNGEYTIKPVLGQHIAKFEKLLAEEKAAAAAKRPRFGPRRQRTHPAKKQRVPPPG